MIRKFLQCIALLISVSGCVNLFCTEKAGPVVVNIPEKLEKLYNPQLLQIVLDTPATIEDVDGWWELGLSRYDIYKGLAEFGPYSSSGGGYSFEVRLIDRKYFEVRSRARMPYCGHVSEPLFQANKFADALRVNLGEKARKLTRLKD